MNKLTAYQKYLIANATLITASRLIFQKLEQSQIQTHRLSEIAETTSGGTPSRTVSRYYGGNIPWIKSGELNDGVVEQAEEFITEEGLKDSSAKVYPQGTLVIALYGATVGKIGILGIDAASNQAVCAITPITNKVNTNFLFWFLRSKRQDFLKNSFGGAQPNISQKIIRETILPIPEQRLQQNICEFLEIIERRQNGEKNLQLPKLPPPLEEQRRIVARVEELVGKFEEVRSLRQKALEEAEALRVSSAKAVFHELAQASTQPLRELVTVQGGGTPSKQNPFFWDGSIPWISPKDMKSREINNSIDHISEEATIKSSAKLLEPGSVLIVVRGMILAHTVPSGILRISAAINQDMKALFPNEKITPEFLCCVFWTLNDSLLELVEKSTHDTRKLETPKLLNFKIPVPPLPEQRRIVAYLDELQTKVDTMKRLREQAMKELDALIPSILDKAFKGKL